MKRLGLIVALWAAWSAYALAQPTNAGGPSASEVLDQLVSSAEKEIIPAAEAMPEEKYKFVPTNGEFSGVRTFAEQLKHLAAANYQLAARILGEKPPHGERNETAPDSVKTKTDVVEYVKSSFVYLHKAVATVNANNLAAPIPGMKGTWQRTRLGSVIDAIAHSYDHYGQIVEYLRMNGVIPSASR